MDVRVAVALGLEQAGAAGEDQVGGLEQALLARQQLGGAPLNSDSSSMQS